MRRFVCLLAVFIFQLHAQEKYCVVVDGYSTGKYYPQYFKKEGYSCIHIKSDALAFLGLDFYPDNYEIKFENPGNLELLLNFLKPYEIACVVPGCEIGIELAEQIGIALHLPSNTPGAGARCRDKFLTGETLKAKGLRSVKQAKVSSEEEALNWVKTHKCWPIVIKPINSAGADGFHLCQNSADVVRAVNSLLGKTNFLGIKNNEVLIQEYLKGTEYIVNTVSLDSKHYVQSFMVYGRRESADGRMIFEDYSLCKASDYPRAEVFFQYARDVLDALGIRQGAAHLELIDTEEGAVLVECNARLHGHSFPDPLMQECLGQSQVELTVLGCLHPKEFLQKTKEPYTVHKYMKAVHLISLHEGTIHGIRFLDQIEKLPSFYLHRIYRKPGDLLLRTVDLGSSPGDVFLRSESKAMIEKDVEMIRSLEREGIFVF